jgi:hypothetical protein
MNLSGKVESYPCWTWWSRLLKIRSFQCSTPIPLFENDVVVYRSLSGTLFTKNEDLGTDIPIESVHNLSQSLLDGVLSS